jgi:hypothetical protein
MTSGTDQLVLPAATGVGEQPVVHFVTGHDEVVRLSPQLAEFSVRCGRSGGMRDIAYFLSKPGVLPRIPHLLLVSRTSTLDLRSPNLDDLLGVLLIFEQRVSRFGAGAFATNDRSGRSTLIAMPSHRSQVATLASRALLDRGAHLILMSFPAGEVPESSPGSDLPLLTVPFHGKSVARWALRERTVPSYLPLAATFDATLAKMGQRTRSNLRYYRRRAESRLGCMFLPQVEVSREEFLAFNLECMYAKPPEVAGWRYDSLHDLSDAIFMGVRHGDGRWLSMLGGRRYDGRSEILWQLNREGFAVDSLGTVMRSYFIEHEIAHGSHRLYVEGGTPQPIKFSFVKENLIDFVVVRRTLVAKMMWAIAQRYVSPENELLHVLGAKDLEWLAC